MVETHWHAVTSFTDCDIPESFRCADAWAQRLGIPVRRFAAGPEEAALLVPCTGFAGARAPGISWVLDPSLQRAQAPTDWLLVLSHPSARSALSSLLALAGEREPGSPRPRWLAAPEAGSGNRVGEVRFTSAEGSTFEFELEPIDAASPAEQLRRSSPASKLPEGPGNLHRRESWFRRRSGQIS
jgi:hypothetical protein